MTLDTEMDNDIHWGKHYPPEYSSVIEGIPGMLRPIWDCYQVHPVYFVSPEVLYDARCVAVLKEEVGKGAIIGAHLHPEYIEPDRTWGKGIEREQAKYPCSDYPDDIEKEKLKNLTELIKDRLEVTPIWYRAARFGADGNTIRTLNELGYRYDSSVTPRIDWTSRGGPDYRDAPAGEYRISTESLQKEARGETDFSGIIEKPVTIYGKRWGFIGHILPDHWLFYRWLRPTHMTYWEMKHILRQMDRDGMDEGVMMFHSMEVMINKTPYVRTRWMQRYYLWRLEGILKYARKKEYLL